MPTIALAGGASPSLGRAIIVALLSSPKASNWNTIILSRNSRKPLWLRAIDPESTRVQIRAVNYTSTTSLTSALEGVHTLISVVQALDGSQPRIMINLLHAAVQAGVRRFAPSYWGWGPKGWENAVVAKEGVEGVWEECLKYQEKIEIAKFNAGTFMNYIGLGIYPVPEEKGDEEGELKRLQENGGYMNGEDAASRGLLRFGPLGDGSGGLIIGMKNGIAELPIKNDGMWPRLTWTSLDDVGRFVVASLDLPKWEEWMTIVGETLTVGELLTHAEEVTGKTFDVIVEKQADLKKKQATMKKDDLLGQLWTEFKVGYIQDEDDYGVLKPVVNQFCPEVEPMGVRQYMEKFWTG